MKTHSKNQGFVALFLVLAFLIVGTVGYAVVKSTTSSSNDVELIAPVATTSTTVATDIKIQADIKNIEIKNTQISKECSPSSTSYTKAYLSTTGFQASEETAVWGCMPTCASDRKLFVSRAEGVWSDGKPKGSFACVDKNMPDVPSSNSNAICPTAGACNPGYHLDQSCYCVAN